MYRSMKSSTKLFPFLKAPATDTTTTRLSRTLGFSRIWLKALISKVKEWSSLQTLTIWTGPGSLPIILDVLVPVRDHKQRNTKIKSTLIMNFFIIECFSFFLKKKKKQVYTMPFSNSKSEKNSWSNRWNSPVTLPHAIRHDILQHIGQ